MDEGLRKQLQNRADAQGISLHEPINQLLADAVDSPHPITQIKKELAELKAMQAKILNLLQGSQD